MEILLPIAAVTFIVVFVGYLRRSQPKITCPQCHSQQVRKLEEELEKIQQDSAKGYAVKLDVKLIMKTTYRCRDCGYSWTVTAPES